MSETVAILNTTKAEKLVNKFFSAMSKANNSMWNVAKVAHETVTAKDFKQTFGTLEHYAEQINMTKANVSKLVKAYSAKLYLTDSMGDSLPDFTTSQLIEMSPVDDIDKVEFIDAYSINESTPTREIRECAKEWKNGVIDADAKEVDEDDIVEVEDTVEAEESALKDVMTISFNNDIWQIVDPNVISTIMYIINDNK